MADERLSGIVEERAEDVDQISGNIPGAAGPRGEGKAHQPAGALVESAGLGVEGDERRGFKFSEQRFRRRHGLHERIFVRNGADGCELPIGA